MPIRNPMIVSSRSGGYIAGVFPAAWLAEMYHSSYEYPYLDALALTLHDRAKKAHDVWCIFDNTAAGHAQFNALRVKKPEGIERASEARLREGESRCFECRKWLGARVMRGVLLPAQFPLRHSPRPRPHCGHERESSRGRRHVSAGPSF